MASVRGRGGRAHRGGVRDSCVEDPQSTFESQHFSKAGDRVDLVSQYIYIYPTRERYSRRDLDKVVFRLRLATTNACFTCEQARRLVAKFDEHCRKSQLSAPNVFFIKQDWKTNRHTLPSKTPTLAKRDASLFFPKREREREREKEEILSTRERERERNSALEFLEETRQRKIRFGLSFRGPRRARVRGETGAAARRTPPRSGGNE